MNKYIYIGGTNRNMNARSILLILILAQLSCAASPIGNIDKGASDLCAALACLLPIVMMMMVGLSAVIYAAGQFMGAETRARAVTWATAALAGALMAGLIAYVGPAVMNAIYGSNIICACSGAGGTPVKCLPVGSTCASTANCCKGDACIATKCTAPATCLANGNTCLADAQCCNPSTCNIVPGSSPPTKACGSAACVIDGDPCPSGAGAICCSGTCNAGTCGPAVACKPAGFYCTYSSECCQTPSAQMCINNKCDVPCALNGATGCGAASSIACCSGICAAGTCVASCKADGNVCSAPADCCNSICNSNSICGPCVGGTGVPCNVIPGNPPNCCTPNVCDLSVGLCRTACSNRGGGCSASGDCCDPKDVCDSGFCVSCSVSGSACNILTQNCCPGFTCSMVSGSPVCTGCLGDGISGCAGSPSLCCTNFCTSHGICGCYTNGAMCDPAVPSDCCGGFCNSNWICGCEPDGRPCSVAGDCCTSPCVNGYCGCAINGAKCGSHGDCCAGFCNSVGSCGCNSFGQGCGVNGDCCNNVCDTLAGKCSCHTMGASCSNNNECCNGVCIAATGGSGSCN